MTTSTLNSYAGIEEFAIKLLGAIRAATEKSRYFSPMGFVVVTKDPDTGNKMGESAAVPVSTELLFDTLTTEEQERVKKAFKTPQDFLKFSIAKLCQTGEASAVITISSGFATGLTSYDGKGEDEEKSAVVVTLRSRDNPSRAWIAEVTRGSCLDTIESLGEFSELHPVPDDGLAEDFVKREKVWN